MTRWLMVTLLCTAPLLQAVQSQAAPGDTAQTPDSIESFDPPTPDALRSLYNQALGALQEYIEVDGSLPQDGETQTRVGEFRLKVFPQGKSRSQRRGIVPPLARPRTTGVLPSFQILQTPVDASAKRRHHLARVKQVTTPLYGKIGGPKAVVIVRRS